MAGERHGPTVLNDAFKELALAVGGVVATHTVPDDVAWDLARVIDHVYRKAQSAMATHCAASDDKPGESGDGMHPAIVRLLAQLREGGDGR